MGPVTTPPTPRDRLLTGAAWGALAGAVVYLAWRAATTLAGADPVAAGLLLAAEGLGAIGFAARVRSARRAPIVAVASPDAPVPDTAAVIDAEGATVDEVRTTLLSVRRVRGLRLATVVDPGESPAIRLVAERLGATIAAPGTTAEAAVREAPTGWVLVLRAGDLPMPDLVAVCAPRCSAPDVAVVQVGFEEADPASFDHDPDGWWSPVPFEQQVMRPSLAARGSIPWYGDGPALVRRSALSAAATTADGRILRSARRIGLDLIRAGFGVTQVPVTLARVRGPAGVGDSLVRRQRRTRRALAQTTPGRLRGLPLAARTAHLLAGLPTLMAIQRVLLVAVAVAVLVAGGTPLVADPWPLAILAGSAYGLRAWALLLLGRGRLRPRMVWRSELRSLGVDLLPFLRTGPRVHRAGLSVLVVVTATLAGAVGVGAVAWWREWPDRAPATVAVVTTALAVGFLGLALEVLVDSLARRQRRHQLRVRLGLVTCRVEEHDGQLVDLSTGGAGVVVAAPPEAAPPVGEVTTVSFRIPDADGAWRNVVSLARIRHRRPEPGGGTRLGLAFDDATDAPLDPVVEFLTIDRRLVALGRDAAVAG